jgi:hypothetical protein
MKTYAKTLLGRYSILSALLLSLATAAFVVHATSQPAGVVLLASGQANAQTGSDAVRTLSRRSDIYVGDRITTGTSSQVQLRMKDGAMIALGANAEFVVKAYSEASKGDKKDEAVLSLVKGGLRTISGKIEKSTFAMNTPTATLGIRGTVFDVYVRPDGSTVVILRDGIVMVVGKVGGQEQLTKPGTAVVINPGKVPTTPAAPPADVLDYLRGILPTLPDNTTWESDGNGGATVNAGTDIINIINDTPPEVRGNGSVPGAPSGAMGCGPNDWQCQCRNNPYSC